MAAILYERKDLDARPNSRLARVIVYQGRAQASRRLSVALVPGPQTVVFTALGREIEEENIKAATGDARARVVSIALEKKNLYFFNKKENEKTAREMVSALRFLIELCDRKTILAVEAGLIAELREYLEIALGEILLDQNVAVTRLREALDFLRGLLDRNRSDAVAAGADYGKAVERYQRLAAAIEEIRRLDKKETHEIRVEIESAAAFDAEVEIAYALRHASWRSSYDAALEDGGQRLVLSVFGEITQASGEDWEGAEVVLSSAETETGLAIPDLHPVGLTGYEEKIQKEVVTEEEEISDLTVGGGGAEAGEPAPRRTGEEEAAGGKKGTAYAFTLPRPETIPSDGRSHRLLIRRDESRPTLSYETVPARMEYVYLKAVFANAQSAPLLPGTVMVYRNGSYVGRTGIGYIASGEECALSFGIDLDIKVKRIVLKDQYTPPKGAGLVRQRREFVFRYILSHYKEAPLAVTVKEAIHVSEVEKIKVKIEDDTSEGRTLDREGIVSFRREIPPGKFEQTLLRLHYSIEAPKSFNLQGV